MIIDAILAALAGLLAFLAEFMPFLPWWILAEFAAYTIECLAWMVSAIQPLTYYVPIGFAVKLGIARIDYEVGMIIWYFVRWLLGHLPWIGGGE